MIFSVRVLPVEELLDVRVAHVVLAQDRLFFYLEEEEEDEEREKEKRGDEKKKGERALQR